MRVIEKDKLFEYLPKPKNDIESDYYCEITNTISDLPEYVIDDVQSVKHGKWIDVYEYCKINGYKPSGVAAYRWCSECMKGQEKTSDFCPNCGAKMSTEVKPN